MGGDFVPQNTVKGVLLAKDVLPKDAQLVLFGPTERIINQFKELGASHENFEIVEAPEVIEMGDHPAKAFQQKPNSTLAIGLTMLNKGKLDGFASGGNTGAVLIGVMYIIKSIPGVIRPCIAVSIPRPDGSKAIIADVGINPDCRPDVLYQYAILSAKYAECVHGINNPKVGLLNIGSEPDKGNLLIKATYDLMKDSTHFNFFGNLEGNDLLTPGMADVVICDGFVGNVVLKQTEAFYSLMKKRDRLDDYFDRFDFENYGGTPILGVNKVVIIGHGASSPRAVQNMIAHTYEVAQANLIQKLIETF
jgi:glycerol-3-phosphate acyltransferase PlsX